MVGPSIADCSTFLKNNVFVFENADKQFDLVFSALKAGRSLAASYNLQADIQRKWLISTATIPDVKFILLRTVFFYIQSDQEATLFESQLPTIVALTKGCKSAKVVRELSEIPAGCGGGVVTPSIAVHTLVRVSWSLF